MKAFLINLSLLFLIVCTGSAQKTDRNDPVKNFDYLWQLFDQHYASFPEKQIDWDAVYREYRPKISVTTSKIELFRIISDMLRPLHDGHVNLIARDLDTAFTAARPSRIMETLRPVPARERRKLFNAAIEQTLQEHDFPDLKEIGPEYEGRPLFTFGNNGRFAYLRFTRSFKDHRFLSFTSLNSLLNQIFATFSDLDNGLILDIRFNIGGDDSFSKKVAGRFVTEKKLTYYKQTRKDGTFGKLQSHYLSPKGKPNFTGPVVLLTNDKTLSAADVLALMMSQLPQVTLMGEPSNGSYSDLMAEKLPNGWTVTLSNQRYLSLEKKNYEGKGTPVDVRVENSLEAIREGEDEVLTRAIQLLTAGE